MSSKDKRIDSTGEIHIELITEGARPGPAALPPIAVLANSSLSHRDLPAGTDSETDKLEKPDKKGHDQRPGKGNKLCASYRGTGILPNPFLLAAIAIAMAGAGSALLDYIGLGSTHHVIAVVNIIGATILALELVTVFSHFVHHRLRAMLPHVGQEAGTARKPPRQPVAAE